MAVAHATGDRSRHAEDDRHSGLEPAGGVPPLYGITKRAIDLAIAGAVLVLFSPLWLLIAVAIKLDSRGPVLFRQTRVGRDGRAFEVYKFRSMHVNNDDSAHRAYVQAFIAGQAAEQTTADGKPYFRIKADPRVTRVGRLIRKTSLDEIPQLLNVIRGAMSIVGPRPALPYEVENYEPWQLDRLQATPGITGRWQVYGRSRVTFDEMVRMDIEYARRPSVWQDLKLMVLTVPALLAGSGAE